MYRRSHEIVADMLGRLDTISEKWQRNTLNGARKWEEWMNVFKSRVEAVISGKAGQVLDEDGMKQLINAIKEARKDYAQKRRGVR